MALYQKWKYKGIISISNPPRYDSFQAEVSIPWINRMKEEFEDLRFSSTSGKALKYKILSYTTGVSANVLVSLPQYAGRIFYYFGNPEAESESTEDVYDVSENFPSTTLDTSKWVMSGGSLVDDGTGNYVAQIVPTTVSSSIRTVKSFTTPIKITGRMQLKTLSSGGYVQGGVFAKGTQVSGKLFCLLDGSSGGNQYAVGTYVTSNASICASIRVAYALDTWYDFTFTTENAQHIFSINGVTVTCNLSNTSTGTVQFNSNANYGTIWYDNLRIQKYSVTPPVLTVRKPSINQDPVYYAGNTEKFGTTLGLSPTVSIKDKISAASNMGLKGAHISITDPINVNSILWIHSKIDIKSFNRADTEIKFDQDYSSKETLPSKGSEMGFSPAVLTMDRIQVSSQLGLSPGGGQTAGKMKVESRLKLSGATSNKSKFSVTGAEIKNVPSYLTLERYEPVNADMGLSGRFEGKQDFITANSNLGLDQALKFTLEKIIIPGASLGLSPRVQYKSPFPVINANLGLSPQNYPIKKKWFLVDYNVVTVEIRKTISDTLWTLDAEFAGRDCPTEFEGLNHSVVDHNGEVQHLFTGVTPDSAPSLSSSESSSRITGYDYGYYLSKQYLPDDCLTINLQGSITSWRDWIQYLLKGSGIAPYKIAYVDMPDVTFAFTGKTTKRQAIDEISSYCGCIFEVAFFNHGTPTAPIWVTGAYWIPIGDIDSFTQGLDLPDPKIFSWPNPYMETLPEVSGNPEEKINRVRIRGTDGTNVYSCTLETAEVTNGDDIARELYEDQEENKALTSQEAVDARAAELLAYYDNPPYQVTSRMIMRYDLRLYQKIKFDTTFPEKLSSLTDGSKGGVTWLRITEIVYHCEAGNNYVEFKAISDTETAILLAAQGEGSYTLLDNIETVSKLLTTNP